MNRRFAAVSRREFLQAGAVAMVGGSGAGFGALRALASVGVPADGPADPHLGAVKALVFDVVGTVVDWRTTVAGAVAELAKRKGVTVDAAKFANAWHDADRPSMDRVRRGELPWTRLDALRRMALAKIVGEFSMPALSNAEMDALNRAWNRLQPWPDAVSGLTRLEKKFIIAPLSNNNISAMVEIAKLWGLPWDCVLGAELVRRYKPDPAVYLSAAEILELKPAEVMMVAAHLDDLRGAKRAGLSTGFVTRPLEFGPNGKPDLKPDSSVDVTAKDFNDLAGQFGA